MGDINNGDQGYLNDKGDHVGHDGLPFIISKFSLSAQFQYDYTEIFENADHNKAGFSRKLNSSQNLY